MKKIITLTLVMLLSYIGVQAQTTTNATVEKATVYLYGATLTQTATATLKKTILPYTEEVNDGWYTIASPVDGLSVDVATEGNYDLYAYDV